VKCVAQNCILSIKELCCVLRTVRPNTITVRITGHPWLCDRKTRVVPNHACYACKRAACNPISPRRWPGSPPTHVKFWAAVLIQVRGNLCNTTHTTATCCLPATLSTFHTSDLSEEHTLCKVHRTPSVHRFFTTPFAASGTFYSPFRLISASRRCPARALPKTTPPRSRFRTNPVRRA
jgi:hypothetical protein